MYSIYKITSPTGRVYIGLSKNIKQRFKDYRKLKCSDQPKLFRTFKKYGVRMHSFTVIHKQIPDVCEAKRLERLYISLFKSNSKKGLNCTDGGDFNPFDIPHIRTKMRQAARKPRPCRRKPVIQYDMQWNELNTFDSIKQAVALTGSLKSNISQCCNGKQSYHNGSRWGWR